MLDNGDISDQIDEKNKAGHARVYWEVVYDISIGGNTYKLPVRGPKGLEPTCEGERGQQELEFIQAAFIKAFKGVDIAYELDSSLKELAPGLRLDFSTVSMAAEKDCIIANPHWLIESTPEAIAVIIVHEFRHIQRNDALRSRTFLDGLDKSEPLSVWRIALNAGADLVINSGLVQALDKAGMLDCSVALGYGDYAEFPLGLESEDYARRIMADPRLRAQMEWHVMNAEFRKAPVVTNESNT